MDIRTNRTIRYIAIAAFALLFGLAGCELDDDGGTADVTDTADTGQNPDMATVTFSGGGVSDNEVTISPGGTVTFVNNEPDVEYIIQILDLNDFTATLAMNGGSATATFPNPGVYEWRENNTSDLSLTGQVVVE